MSLSVDPVRPPLFRNLAQTRDSRYSARADDGRRLEFHALYRNRTHTHTRTRIAISLPNRSMYNDQLAVLGEFVYGDLEVQGSGAFPYTAGDVVVRTVAGAEPSAVIASLADGDTTKMRADA